jgi:hypothetical protein
MKEKMMEPRQIDPEDAYWRMNGPPGHDEPPEDEHGPIEDVPDEQPPKND